METMNSVKTYAFTVGDSQLATFVSCASGVQTCRKMLQTSNSVLAHTEQLYITGKIKNASIYNKEDVYISDMSLLVRPIVRASTL